MIVVDTSVWVDHLRDADTPEVVALRSAITQRQAVGITGVIRTELLQGVAERSVPALARDLDSFPLVSLEDSDYDLAARLFRSSRSAGTTVRNVVDCLIAAPCIRLGVPLLHKDVDFDKLAAISDLRVVAV
jgi:predicted nucleic acid-binding protein